MQRKGDTMFNLFKRETLRQKTPETIKDFRSLKEENWNSMDDRVLGKNIKSYRSLLLTEAASDPKNQDISRDQRLKMLVYADINRQHPPLGETSTKISKEMSTSPLFPNEDRKVCNQISIITHTRSQERQQQSSQPKIQHEMAQK
jgi:uncharacterized coiled-coil DUF342 family protein